ncbi:hypothetical protein QVD17_06663 [Tagetes erecta]|uniref:Uncharacterized protein n=1 Tax=Tagetes erecta TaxID=13708 RepID=A0AAD8LL30_TARER|nr:hypothetical protein QVD17_06663 [Tagetes erecta]
MAHLSIVFMIYIILKSGIYHSFCLQNFIFKKNDVQGIMPIPYLNVDDLDIDDDHPSLLTCHLYFLEWQFSKEKGSQVGDDVSPACKEGFGCFVRPLGKSVVCIQLLMAKPETSDD